MGSIVTQLAKMTECALRYRAQVPGDTSTAGYLRLYYTGLLYG